MYKYRVKISKEKIVTSIEEVDEFIVEAETYEDFLKKSFAVRKAKGYTINEYGIKFERVDNDEKEV